MPSSVNKEEILKSFREQLFDEDILHDGDTIGTDDETLLRFLRARNFDLVQSKKMFKECQEWRKTIDGDGIDELYRQMDWFDYPERDVLLQYWPLCFHKMDKKGRPITIQLLSQLDTAKLYAKCSPEKHTASIVIFGETLLREVLPAASRVAGEYIGTSLVIIDLKGFGLSQFWQIKSQVQTWIKITQDYFPETMGQVIVINAPSSFTFIWNAVKHLLSAETISKVNVLGSDYRDILLQLVDEENLPEIVGGKCKCEGEDGCIANSPGPWKEGRVGWGPNSKKKEDSASEKVAENEGNAATSISTVIAAA